ncbi:MAG: DEAD/DEAH box helicase, partial [Dehalococcoidales bacterium]|nr:DEAD/DEAH box helicase [Dehalococcoidales bacterium]
MSELFPLLELIGNTESFRRLLAGLRREKDTGVVVLNVARPFVVAALHEYLRRPLLVVTARPEDARRFLEQISLFLAPRVPAALFPEPDVLPYELVATDAAAGLDRIGALAVLAGGGVGDNDRPPLVIASAPALVSRTIPYRDFVSSCQTIGVGEERDMRGLIGSWLNMGYRLADMVEAPGGMSHRGGILDIWPATAEAPVRLEFFGNSIESLRRFDPASQRSTEKLESVFIAPASELLAPWRLERHEMDDILRGLDLGNCNTDFTARFRQDTAMLLEGQLPPEVAFYAALFNTGNILDYLPPGTLVVVDEPEMVEEVAVAFDGEAEELRSAKLERGELPRNFPRPYFTWEEIVSMLGSRPVLRLVAWGEEASLDFSAVPDYTGRLPQFLEKVRELSYQRRRVVIVSHQASRLSELLGEKDIFASPLEHLEEVPSPGNVALVAGSLAGGWVMGGEVCLFTDAEVFGFVKQRRLVRKRAVARKKLLVDFAPGDYVVHVEHGIGKFRGVTTLATGGVEKEYLILEYAGGDTLYVPTDQIDRVSRYVGIGDKPPLLSRLGTQEWNRTRQKAKEATAQLARELLALYAAREVVPGFAFSPDTPWQREMEAAFPYVETPDQLRAQQEVKADMERPRPMDRLILGDVGYGKTEVAIRAAFKAVMDGKQVAVVVPTTVLAQQHYATFTERLQAFPVKIEVLSRFRSEKEQRAVLAGLADGTIDICIGTHRLLQKDVSFRDLGLLIIDEEQRFG